MTFLTFFDCSGCGRISYYDCSGSNSANVVKKNGYVYYNVPPIQCRTCCSDCTVDKVGEATQKRIQNTVRVANSLYLDDLASLTVRGSTKNTPKSTFGNVNQSQASDRNVLSSQNTLANPRLRPGKLGPGGVGVDVKHNSFDRILARKKAQNIRTDSKAVLTPNTGNRVRKFGIVTQEECKCNTHFSFSFF